jgi:hypothetical protein
MALGVGVRHLSRIRWGYRKSVTGIRERDLGFLIEFWWRKRNEEKIRINTEGAEVAESWETRRGDARRRADG